MPGSTNFLQFNPGANNQETDSAYASDSARVGGAVTGIFASVLLNKVFYQSSTFIAALANALANKGYSPNDTDLATLESVLANIVTFADLKANLTSVSFSTTPVFNATSTNGFDFVIAAPVTSSTLVNTQIGQTLTFIIVQGATPFSFTPPTNINGWIPVPVTANSVFVQTFIVRQDGTIWPNETEIGILISELAALQTIVNSLNSPIFLASQNGYEINPASGIIRQWGYASSSNTYITLPLSFPTNFWNLKVSNATQGGAFSDPAYGEITNLSSFFCATRDSQNGSISNFPIFWEAIGN